MMKGKVMQTGFHTPLVAAASKRSMNLIRLRDQQALTVQRTSLAWQSHAVPAINVISYVCLVAFPGYSR